jgi:hypothetical protein
VRIEGTKPPAFNLSIPYEHPLSGCYQCDIAASSDGANLADGYPEVEQAYHPGQSGPPDDVGSVCPAN